MHWERQVTRLTAHKHAVGNKLAHARPHGNIQRLEEPLRILAHEIKPAGDDHVAAGFTDTCYV